MSIGLDTDHVALADSVRGFVARHAPSEAVRAGMPDWAAGAAPDCWPGIVDQGLTSLHLPEEFDGGTRKRHLPGLAAGVTGATALTAAGLTATPLADGEYLVAGSTTPVLGAAGAALLLLGATTPAGGDLWFVVEPGPGIEVAAGAPVDHTRAVGVVTLTDVVVRPAQVVGVGTDQVRAAAAVLFAAEAVGLARWCLDTGVAYVKVREQFGRPVGSFQAIKHKCARMFIDVEMMSAAAWDAARSLEQDEEQFALGAAVACLPKATEIGLATITMLGGIGYTWEHDEHLYWRRAMTEIRSAQAPSFRTPLPNAVLAVGDDGCTVGDVPVCLVRCAVSLQPQPWPEVPVATAKVARKAFRKGTLAMRIRDELGPLFTDEEFAVAFATRGRPGLSPGQLALVSVLQFAENLSDWQAALQVTARIDWKYALGLALDGEGFDHSVLSGFRARLVEHGLEEKVLDLLLARLSKLGLLRAGGRARTDSTHVLAAVRSLNRLEFVGETMRAALEALAVAAPGWLTGVVEPGWDRRYQARVESYRLPASAAGRAELAVTIGRDGFALLTALGAADAPVWLWEVPAVDVLRITWIQQYHRTVGDGGTEVAWREDKDLPPGRLRLASPYDLAARYGVKRGSGWVGYKVHLTETCDDDTPHVITNVETTNATVTDQETTPVVHGHLAGRGLLPAEHAVDTGYTSTELFLTSATEHGVALVGPLGVNTSWQARTPGAFDLSDFTIDWDRQQVTCPNGAVSSTWRTEKARGKPVLKVDFRRKDCLPCPLRARCTSSATNARKLTLRHREQHELLERLRVEQATDAWKKRYDRRAGVEGTMRQATAVTGIRHARYHGQDKNHLAHVLAATAVNIVRLDAWWTGTPTGRTRTTHFSTLVSTAAA